MPIFDFECKDCGQKFDLMVANDDKDKVRCRSCDSANVKQLLSLFSTGKGDAGKASLPPCAAGCCKAGSKFCHMNH